MITMKGWGVACVLLAGVLNGSFMLPMKRIKAWPWENVWLIYSMVGMVILPWTLALSTVPRLGDVYRNTAWSVLVKVVLFGMAWGGGSTLFGIGVRRVGMALGYSLIFGITASFGSLFPLLFLHPESLMSGQGWTLMGGTALVMVGLIFLCIAGRMREREMRVTTSAVAFSGFAMGLVICIFSGLFSSMLNFSFIFGIDLQHLASSFGSSPTMSANSIWCLTLSAGFIVNAICCGRLLSKNHTWHLLWEPGFASCWMSALLMAFIWFGCIVAYGIGAASLGVLGGIVGWPLLMSMTVVGANAWGVLTGEWKGARRSSLSYWCVGLASLLLAIYLISRGAT